MDEQLLSLISGMIGKVNEDVLSSKAEIISYMKWTDHMFEAFRAFRFPAAQINGRWWASKIALATWWVKFCNVDSSKFPKGGE